jgi:hypothetical protein
MILAQRLSEGYLRDGIRNSYLRDTTLARLYWRSRRHYVLSFAKGFPPVQTARPQDHWTDQKICVHIFYCLLALLLGRLVEFKARQLHRTEGLSGLLDLLATVRLAIVRKPAGNKGGRRRCEWTLERTEPQAMRLFRHLVPALPPFVYT